MIMYNSENNMSNPIPNESLVITVLRGLEFLSAPDTHPQEFEKSFPPVVWHSCCTPLYHRLSIFCSCHLHMHWVSIQ